MHSPEWIEVEIGAMPVGSGVHVRLRECGERWAASVRCGATTSDGLGTSAREALVAALMPLGARMTAAVMSAPAMFAASAQVLAARAAV